MLLDLIQFYCAQKIISFFADWMIELGETFIFSEDTLHTKKEMDLKGAQNE